MTLGFGKGKIINVTNILLYLFTAFLKVLDTRMFLIKERGHNKSLRTVGYMITGNKFLGTGSKILII